MNVGSKSTRQNEQFPKRLDMTSIARHLWEAIAKRSHITPSDHEPQGSQETSSSHDNIEDDTISSDRGKDSSAAPNEDHDVQETSPDASTSSPADSAATTASSAATSVSNESSSAHQKFALVFDIDGVLVHGDQALPEAKKALEILNGKNDLNLHFAYIFLTNGSGYSEHERCEQLSKTLEVPVSTDEFIQAHTPMQDLAKKFDTVLVIGGKGSRCREIAKRYGFRDVIIPEDIVAWDPSIAPNHSLDFKHCQDARIRDFSTCDINAILVLSDSHDYGTDMQIIIDVLGSTNGRLKSGRCHPKDAVPIYFSQGDLLCPTEHEEPRLSQGVFRIALESVYHTLTNESLSRTVYGKPELITYQYAESLLKRRISEVHGVENSPTDIYMIGDNPASDIAGGNQKGWHTALVRTGIFKDGDNDNKNSATFGVFDNVLKAVEAVLHKHMGDDFLD